jgi:glucose-1-phosphate adenylyltransferase
MDLLGKRPTLMLNDESWRIYARHNAMPPQYIGEDAKIENSVVTEGCEVYGTVKNSVLGSGVKIGYGAYVKDSVIMDNTVIHDGACVNYSIIDSDCEVGAGAKIGEDRKKAAGVTVLGRGSHIEPGTEVESGAMISSN